MNVLISGGAKNGKSYYAQRIAQQMAEGGELRRPLYYIATMIPHDEEDHARIRRHIAERDGWGFETIEQGREILKCLDMSEKNGTFLLDSVTALVQNEMFKEDKIDLKAGIRVAEELVEFAGKVKNAVMVSDYIFADAERYDMLTEEYRRALAMADKTAKECDLVIEVCAGNYIVHKGELYI